MATTTIITYRGFAFDIGTKDANAVNFFLEENPSVEDFKNFLMHTYRDVTITEDKNKNPHPNEPIEPERIIPHEPVEYEPKPKPEYPKMPELPPIALGKIELEIMAERVSILNTADYEFSVEYAQNTLKRARHVHDLLRAKEEVVKQEEDRLIALKECADQYEHCIKQYSMDSSHRQRQQRVLNDLTTLLVTQFSL